MTSVHSADKMSAKLLSGTELARSLRQSIKQQIEEIRNEQDSVGRPFTPRLAIVQVGDRADSSVYIRAKCRAATEVGIDTRHVKLSADCTHTDVMHTVAVLNADPSVNGIIVQLPMEQNVETHREPHHVINEAEVIAGISPHKDVDGLHPYNAGLLARGVHTPGHVPCTPAGCMRLIDEAVRLGWSGQVEGSTAVVLGRSRIVGAPMFDMLRMRNATVTQVHSRTRNVAEIVARADILVVAIGKHHFVQGEWIKRGCVVIDCGINAVYVDVTAEDGTVSKRRRLQGDVDTQMAGSRAAFITPVPGGVGPMTVAILLHNTLECALETRRSQTLAPWSGTVSLGRDEVPPLQRLVSALGLCDNEVEMYGKHQAKIDACKVLARLAARSDAGATENRKVRYIAVSGITPTAEGEGKTTTLLGLCQALDLHFSSTADKTKQGRAIACLRQPSLGPLFGSKGGAAGGGKSSVYPSDLFNMSHTGDMHALCQAHNLLAAQLDSRIYHESRQTSAQLRAHLCPQAAGEEELRQLLEHSTEPCMRVFQRRYARLQCRFQSHADDVMVAADSQCVDDILERVFRLDIDPHSVCWPRVLDVCDRALRQVTVPLPSSPTSSGDSEILTRHFCIAAASELMSVLALSTDLQDLWERVARIVVAYERDTKQPITCDDLGVADALVILLADSLKPTLMQTAAGTAVLAHAGPFANMSIGCSSVLADRLATQLLLHGSSCSDGYVVTEAGFGSEVGLEKLCDIKCRVTGTWPDAVVLVTTVRAVLAHGLDAGVANLRAHINNCRAFQLPAVVAVNARAEDTQEQLDTVVQTARDCGACEAVVCTHYREGGAGALQLAQAVMRVCDGSDGTSQSRHLYPLDACVEEKIRSVAVTMYGADGVEYTEQARADIEEITRLGFAALPLCVAKTPLSLSHNSKWKGAPAGYMLDVTGVQLNAGSGMLLVLTGDINLLPGLTTRPRFHDMHIDTSTGRMYGVS